MVLTCGNVFAGGSGFVARVKLLSGVAIGEGKGRLTWCVRGWLVITVEAESFFGEKVVHHFYR